MIQVYSRNYGSKERGKRLFLEFYCLCLSWNNSFPGGGNYLDAQSADPDLIFMFMGMVALASALTLFLIPSDPIEKGIRTHGLLDSFILLKKDRLFASMFCLDDYGVGHCVRDYSTDRVSRRRKRTSISATNKLHSLR